MRYTTAEMALYLAIDALEAYNICPCAATLREKIYDWYNHTDVTDPEVLAAVALEGKKWRPDFTYDQMLEIRNYWFPQEQYEVH